VRRLKRVWCWIVGHRMAPENRPFSRRLRICARCGHVPPFLSLDDMKDAFVAELDRAKRERDAF
jgi:hypothetical protein